MSMQFSSTLQELEELRKENQKLSMSSQAPAESEGLVLRLNEEIASLMTKSQDQEIQISALTKDNSEKYIEIMNLKGKLSDSKAEYEALRKGDEVWRNLMIEQYFGAKEKLEKMLQSQRPSSQKQGLGYSGGASSSGTKSSDKLADRFIKGKVQTEAELTPPQRQKLKGPQLNYQKVTRGSSPKTPRSNSGGTKKVRWAEHNRYPQLTHPTQYGSYYYEPRIQWFTEEPKVSRRKPLRRNLRNHRS